MESLGHEFRKRVGISQDEDKLLRIATLVTPIDIDTLEALDGNDIDEEFYNILNVIRSIKQILK